MASHVYVVDSSARRHQIKTTPTTYLRDVLEEACRKLNRDPNHYSLQDSSRPPKTIDLSSQIRLSGLVSGAKLQLVQQSRSPSVISVALQLPEALGGGRLQNRFSSDTSLWLVLRRFEDDAATSPSKLNITQRGRPSTTSGSGTLDYEQPVVHILGRDLRTFAELQKTLMQLGFSGGNVLLRLSFVGSGQPMHLAMEEITQYFSPSSVAQSIGDEASAANSTNTNGADLTDKGGVPSIAAVQDVTAWDTWPEPQVSQPDTVMSDAPPLQAEQQIRIEESASAVAGEMAPEPEMHVYKPSSTPTPQAAAANYDPDDYVPTVDHAKSHQATLNRAARNQRLLSDAELAQLEQEKQDKLATIHSTVVRVRLPDQMMIDLSIAPEHTPADLYDIVRAKMAAPHERFDLRYTSVKGAPLTLDRADKRRRLIKDLGFTQRILLTMVWHADASASARHGVVLKESLRAQAVELKIPGAMHEGREKDRSMATASASGKDGSVLDKAKSSKQDVEAKMKKFLGFGAKRK